MRAKQLPNNGDLNTKAREALLEKKRAKEISVNFNKSTLSLVNSRANKSVFSTSSNDSDVMSKRSEQIAAAYKGQLTDVAYDEEEVKVDEPKSVPVPSGLRPRQVQTDFNKKEIVAKKKQPIIKAGQNPKEPVTFIGPQLPQQLKERREKDDADAIEYITAYVSVPESVEAPESPRKTATPLNYSKDELAKYENLSKMSQLYARFNQGEFDLDELKRRVDEEEKLQQPPQTQQPPAAPTNIEKVEIVEQLKIQQHQHNHVTQVHHHHLQQVQLQPVMQHAGLIHGINPMPIAIQAHQMQLQLQQKHLQQQQQHHLQQQQQQFHIQAVPLQQVLQQQIHTAPQQIQFSHAEQIQQLVSEIAEENATAHSQNEPVVTQSGVDENNAEGMQNGQHQTEIAEVRQEKQPTPKQDSENAIALPLNELEGLELPQHVIMAQQQQMFQQQPQYQQVQIMPFHHHQQQQQQQQAALIQFNAQLANQQLLAQYQQQAALGAYNPFGATLIQQATGLSAFMQHPNGLQQIAIQGQHPFAGGIQLIQNPQQQFFQLRPNPQPYIINGSQFYRVHMPQ